MLPLPARRVTDSAAELIGSIKRQEMVMNVALKCYFTRPEHTISCPTRQGCARWKISNQIFPPDRQRHTRAALQGRLGTWLLDTNDDYSDAIMLLLLSRIHTRGGPGSHVSEATVGVCLRSAGSL